MKQKVLFLGSGSPFMVNAVLGNLSTAGYDVMSIELKPETVRTYAEGADAAVLFLGTALLENTATLAAVNELFGVPDKLLLLIGSKDELIRCEQVFPEGAVSASFNKPLDIKKFIAIMDRLTNTSNLRGKKRVLLVDDDGDYLRMVKGWLTNHYRVSVVNSGMQALTFLANNKPDLILLDYTMPVTSGAQVLEMIRSEPGTAHIPVIFLTGKDDSDSVRRVLELKPDGYILKSIDRDSLLERLEEFFSNRP